MEIAPLAWSLRDLRLLGAEAVLLAALLLFLFRLRHRLGLSPLYISIGAFQYLQVVLALSIYVELAPGLLISPGSAVLFSSGLFAVLLVYIREDAIAARRLVYGLVIANLALVSLTSLFALHLDSPASRNLLELPRELFFLDVRVMAVGTLALLLDVVAIIVLYEALSHLLPRLFFLRVFGAMCGVLILDSLVFTTGSFLGSPDYVAILLSGLAGKALAALFFSAVLWAYLRLFRGPELEAELVDAETRDVFHLLTYRQKYEELRRRMVRDPLTGLFNRGFFDELLPLELERSRRGGRPLSLLLIDVDRFKQVNDRFGHQAGDRVLRELAAVLLDDLRSGDAACRIGGEEMALVLPDLGARGARKVAERLHRRLVVEAAPKAPAGAGHRVTTTVGIASFPDEAPGTEELIRLADRRLYFGKRSGRNRVIGSEETGPEPVPGPPPAAPDPG